MNNLTVTGLITPSPGTPSLLGAPAAFAASTVKGLITPSACTPMLSGGGMVDYGKIPTSDLNLDCPTVLDSHTLQLSVSCDASALFALDLIDNRANSAPTSITYGLGLINGTEKLGWYTIKLRNPIADGMEVQPIISRDQGKTWYRDNLWEPGMFVSIASMDDNSQPRPVQDLKMELVVSTTIARTDGLDLSNEVSIDGSATLVVRYL